MGYYTDFEVEVPPTFFTQEDGEEAEEIDKHLEALRARGVEISVKSKMKVMGFSDNIEIKEGIGSTGAEAFVLGGYAFYQGKKRNEFYRSDIKMYEWQDEFKKLSASMTGLFIVTGTGEEPGDYWRAYIKDGKCQLVKPVFPEFDENELK